MTNPNGGAQGRGRALLNRADLVWLIWYGYSPQDAAARMGLSPKTMQRHINALLADPADPDDWITAEVVARLRRRGAVPGERWEDTVPRDPPRNGYPFHDYATGASRPGLRPAVAP
jgi:hypothetical protein